MTAGDHMAYKYVYMLLSPLIPRLASGRMTAVDVLEVKTYYNGYPFSRVFDDI